MGNNLFFGLDASFVTGPPPITPHDLNFNVFSTDLRQNNVARYTDGSGNLAGPYITWDTVSGDTSTGVQTGTKLAAGQSGYIYMGYQNATGPLLGRNVAFGFKTDSTLTDHNSFLAYFFYDSATSGQLGSGSYNTNQLQGIQPLSRIYRDGATGVLTLEVSYTFGNPGSWNIIRTFSVTSTADLWAGVSMYAANPLMVNPKTYNFT